jgi:glutathione S-transferase
LTNGVQPNLRLRWYPCDVPGSAEVESAVEATAVNKLEAAWQRIDTHLHARGPYLLGAEFSAADIFSPC